MTNDQVSFFLRIRTAIRDEEELNAKAMAFIYTERSFRTFEFRLCEYLWSVIKIGLGQSISTMTLGQAQISLRYWTRHEGVSEIRALFYSMSLVKSYRMCSTILQTAGTNELSELARNYNGNFTPYYLKMLEENYQAFSSLSNNG